jgi:riboflavin synthase
LGPELKVDQSVSHNGVCLTVEEVSSNTHKVTAIAETLTKTNLNTLQLGHWVNLERCLMLNGRIDGHLVQGHVDCTATCIKVENKNGSWEYEFEIPVSFGSFVIEKGSISLNGISLTIFNVTHHSFCVAIIPFTFEHTTLKFLKEGDSVNIEFDMIGKYVNRMKTLNDFL